MRTHLLRNLFIVGSAAVALAASAVALPSVADAKGGATYTHGASHGHGRVGGNFRGRGGRGGYGGYGGAGYVGGYYPGFCGPIQLTLGLCGPWGY
jgi:hypothetical protein